MERLGAVPAEAVKFHPAYRNIAHWLRREGISPQLTAEVVCRTYMFYVNASEIVGGDVGVGITGKHEEGTTPSLRFRLLKPSLNPVALAYREGQVTQVFAENLADPLARDISMELHFIDDIPETEEDSHMGYIASRGAYLFAP